MSGSVLSEEETRRFLSGLDPKVIEAVLAQSKAKETPPPYTPLQRVSHGSLPRTVASLDNSSVVGSSVVSPVTSPVVSPRPGDLNMALTVAESVLGGRSPSLRRVSVKPAADEKRGITSMFHKKKSLDPVMVFSFSAEDVDAGGEDREDRERGSGQSCSSSHTSPSDHLHKPESHSRPAHMFEKHARERKVSESPSHAGPKLSVHDLHHDRSRALSVASFRSGHSGAVSMGSPEEVKEVKQARKQRFWDFLSMVLSIAYGLFIFIGSACAYASDLVMPYSYKISVGENWNLFLCLVGTLLLLFLIFDIQRYIKMVSRINRGGGFIDGIRLVEGEDGELHIEVPMHQGQKQSVPEYYGFTSGRHAGSFFLKIGAALFCFGHIIHMLLNMVKHIYSMQTDDPEVEEFCGQLEGLVYDIAHPIFSLVQLYFIFKYGNVIVNKNRWLARFAFSHCMSSCLSFWMHTLFNETLDAIVMKYFPKEIGTSNAECGQDIVYGPSTVPHSTTEDDSSEDFSWTSLGESSEDLMGTLLGGSELLDSDLAPQAGYDWTSCEETGGIGDSMRCVVEMRAQCSNDKGVYPYFELATYLYPFSIEFNILIVAIWYILWTSIGNIQDHKHDMEFLPSVTPQGSIENLHRMEGHKQAKILFADCSSSNGGLFSGVLLLMAVVACSVVLLTMEGPCNTADTILIGNMLRIVVMSILTIASLHAYYIVACLDVNPAPISFLDDMLLFFCLPSFFMYFIVWTAPLVVKPDAASIVANVITCLQVLVQTPMIIDGLRRCTNDPDIGQKMRGRNTVSFLIVANLTVYIMETLLIKSYDYQKPKIEYYGADSWTVLSHITLPICIFYRFHSAVALVDIWNSAYKPPENHH